MSKERLEEIKERVLVDMVYYKYLDGTKGHWGKTYTLSEEDYSYLIEQAGRVQELEKRIADDEHFVAEILEQNKRYREALEKITNDEYIQDYCEEIGCYEYEAMWDIAYIALREWEKNEMR